MITMMLSGLLANAIIKISFTDDVLNRNYGDDVHEDDDD